MYEKSDEIQINVKKLDKLPVFIFRKLNDFSC